MWMIQTETPGMRPKKCVLITQFLSGQKRGITAVMVMILAQIFILFSNTTVIDLHELSVLETDYDGDEDILVHMTELFLEKHTEKLFPLVEDRRTHHLDKNYNQSLSESTEIIVVHKISSITYQNFRLEAKG